MRTAWFHLGEVPAVEAERRMARAEAGRGNGELVCNEDRVSVWDDDKFWTWMVVMVAQQGTCA